MTIQPGEVSDSDRGQTVALLGVGSMGSRMAGRLVAAGYRLHLFDVARDRLADLERLGAVAFSSPAAATVGADVVLVMVATPDQCEEALFGVHGATESMQSGVTLVIMSTVGVHSVTSTAKRLNGRGVRTLDAPVSGGAGRAESGELLIMVGGPTEVLSTAAPVLSVVGTAVVHCGLQVGDGQKMKLVNQLLCGVHIVAASEALNFARGIGLDPAVVLETISSGAAGSFMLDDRGRRMVSREFLPARSALDIFVKDMGLVRAASQAVSVATPLAEQALRVFEDGARAGFGRDDDSGVIRVYESAAVATHA